MIRLDWNFVKKKEESGPKMDSEIRLKFNKQKLKYVDVIKTKSI